MSSWLDPLLHAGRYFLTGARDLVYPGCCSLCAEPLPADQSHFCALCKQSVFTDPHPACPRCGGTIGPYAIIEGRCRACRDESFRFGHVVRLGIYDGLLREVILLLKRQSGEGLAELLGECWAENRDAELRALQVDAVVPVPLHWLRRFRRGYNQSAALGRGLSARLGVSCRPNWLRRIRNTPPQTRQTPAGRKANVRGAFLASGGAAMKGRSLLLVDDVMTTGATADDAARAFLEVGARVVHVAVLARAQG
jgi:ComF family protein